MSVSPSTLSPGHRFGRASWMLGVTSGLLQAALCGWGSSRDLEYGPAAAVGVAALLLMFLNALGIWLGLVAQAMSRNRRSGLPGLWINGLVLAGMVVLIVAWLMRD